MLHHLEIFKKYSEMTADNGADNLVWIDCEMTGLDSSKDCIIEIACIITNEHLEVLETMKDSIVIHKSPAIMESMGEWCRQHHSQSGLTKCVLESNVTTQQAESAVLEMVKRHCPKGKCPLAGNSVHADKVFLVKEFPMLMEHLHYRIVDVSTIKELCRRWYPTQFKEQPCKRETHRALDDIVESIQELKYYQSSIFRSS
jgi:oligoribonuclease